MTSMRKFLTIMGLIAAVCVISLPAGANPIVTESTSNSTVKTETDTTTTVKSAPPSAISPSISGSNSDLCTVGGQWCSSNTNLGCFHWSDLQRCQL